MSTKFAQTVTVKPEDFIQEADDSQHDDSEENEPLTIEIDPADDDEVEVPYPDNVLIVNDDVSNNEECVLVLEEDEPSEVIILIDDIPGAPKGTKVPQIEIVEDDDSEEKDSNNLEQKPRGPWDWRGLEPDAFFVWVKGRYDACPKHSGLDTAGLERALAYMEKFDSEISAAMREDLDGKLDENKIEEVRNQIETGINKLKDRIKEIKDSKKNPRKKKAEEFNEITKEGKALNIGKVLVTVPLLISSLARICINSVVSAGKDLEQVFNEQCEKYDLSEREKTELLQLLEDMNYPLYRDRGYKHDESYSRNSSDNYDWNQNFRG